MARLGRLRRLLDDQRERERQRTERIDGKQRQALDALARVQAMHRHPTGRPVPPTPPRAAP